MKRKEELLKEKQELVEEMKELEKEIEKITWVDYKELTQVNERKIKKIQEEIKNINSLIYYIFER